MYEYLVEVVASESADFAKELTKVLQQKMLEGWEAFSITALPAIAETGHYLDSGGFPSNEFQAREGYGLEEHRIQFLVAYRREIGQCGYHQPLFKIEQQIEQPTRN